ncbi:MAG: hypothetical protein Q4F23_02535 [Coriobacteriia bacterium]|nr:hypothetical protein [Coriobacteriia bacterium]
MPEFPFTNGHGTSSSLPDGSEDTKGPWSAHVVLGNAAKRPFRLLPKRKNRKLPKNTEKRIAFFHYGDYEVAFKFFVEHVVGAEYVKLPPATKRTLELGSAHSTDFVCAPYKHILGTYIEALEQGANVLVQFAGPCRLGYYGELQEAELRSMGYEFEMMNFSSLDGLSPRRYLAEAKKHLNPELKLKRAIPNAAAAFKLLGHLDEIRDFYLANAGFELERGTFEKTVEDIHARFSQCTNGREIRKVYLEGMQQLRNIPIDKPENPLRVGIVGEVFTAVDPFSNLFTEKKLLEMGVEIHRTVNLTNRWVHYNEENLRASITEYCDYDMGPTSSLTIASAKKYAQLGFDGILHLKSSGCTPEIDCMPTLQRISRDYGIPMLFLSFDSQTSDTGLDTRLEAFYDMIARKRTIA